MSEINQNVFDANKRFVDMSGLSYFWTKTKEYVDAVDTDLSGKVTANEGAIKGIQDELNTLSGGVGSVGTQIDNAIAALDLPNTYEAKGAAADALAEAIADAESKYQLKGEYEVAGTAAGLNTAMDARVKVLEAIDHDQLAADASAAAVATVLDGAPEKFDTLKEVAQWIADSESAATAADLVTRVATLEAIDHNAYVAADTALETSLKGYVDGKVDGKFDAAGAAATAEQNAKSYADGKFQVAGNYEAAGTADAKIAALKLSETYEAKGEAAKAQTAAIAQAKVDAAEALKGYYTKGEVDNLLSTNSTGDRAYAKQYTDELFNSFQFAQNSEIDALFA